jgi:hypothetical protein
MIIRPDAGALTFITQHDHARLAADLLAHWTADGFEGHPRRDDLLRAAREHDAGWREIDDEAPAFDTTRGAALDFIGAPDEVKQSVWPRAIERVADASPYAAALIAQHAIAVYDRYAGAPAWRGFFDDLGVRRDLARARTSCSADDLQRDYRFLGVVDLLSLAFCNAWTDVHERNACRVRYAGGGIDVNLPLFAGPVPLRIRVRRLPDRSYASAADLRAALEDAPPEIVEGLARPGVAL